MTKKAGGNSLQAILARASSATPDSGVAENTPKVSISPAPKRAPRAAAPAGDAAPTPARAVPPSREGKKLIGGHFSEDISKQLRMVAIEDGTTVQALLEEAITDLLTKKAARKVGR